MSRFYSRFALMAAIAMAAITTPAVASAAEVIGAEAINLAGEQRMLSQRIVKSYAQIGLNVAPADAAQQLADSIRRFEGNLEALAGLARIEADVGTEYERLSGVWKDFRAAAGAPISRESAVELAARSDEVLAVAERLTRAVEKIAGLREGGLLNRSGRQRMLSQRLAKAYMLRTWGVDSTALRDELDATIAEFGRNLAELGAFRSNSPEIRREIDDIALQWDWLRAAIDAEGAVSYRLIVVEAAEAILQMSDRLTRLYEQGHAR